MRQRLMDDKVRLMQILTRMLWFFFSGQEVAAEEDVWVLITREWRESLHLDPLSDLEGG